MTPIIGVSTRCRTMCSDIMATSKWDIILGVTGIAALGTLLYVAYRKIRDIDLPDIDIPSIPGVPAVTPPPIVDEPIVTPVGTTTIWDTWKLMTPDYIENLFEHLGLKRTPPAPTVPPNVTSEYIEESKETWNPDIGDATLATTIPADPADIAAYTYELTPPAQPAPPAPPAQPEEPVEPLDYPEWDVRPYREMDLPYARAGLDVRSLPHAEELPIDPADIAASTYELTNPPTEDIEDMPFLDVHRATAGGRRYLKLWEKMRGIE